MAYWTPIQVKTAYFLVLKSYLHSRHLRVKVETEYIKLPPVSAGVPQGSALGPLQCLLYTADLLTSPESTTANFADNTVVIATDSDPVLASQKLQTNLAAIKKMENRSYRIQISPCHIHHKKRNAPSPRSTKAMCNSHKKKSIISRDG
jgi:hypothetical protein